MKKYIFILLVIAVTVYAGIGPFPGGSGGGGGLTSPVAIVDGGTGQTSANAAINALLPSQASASGKFLTSNGTDSSWGTVSASPGGSDTQIQFNSSSAFGGSSKLTFNSTTGNVAMTPSGAATYGLTSNMSSVTGNWRGAHISGSIPTGGVQNAFRGSLTTNSGSPSASYPYVFHAEVLDGGGAAAAGTSQFVGFYSLVNAMNSQKTAAGILDGYGNHGAFLDSRNTSGTGNAIGVVAGGRQSNQNIGGHFYSGLASGSNPQNYGVHAITTTDTATAQAVAVYGKIGATQGAALEGSLANASSAAYFDNGDTPHNIFTASDNGTSTFQIKDGGATVIGANGATPIHSINSATVASAASTATLTNFPTAGNPSLFLKIQINNVYYYIPAWTAP